MIHQLTCLPQNLFQRSQFRSRSQCFSKPKLYWVPESGRLWWVYVQITWRILVQVRGGLEIQPVSWNRKNPRSKRVSISWLLVCYGAWKSNEITWLSNSTRTLLNGAEDGTPANVKFYMNKCKDHQQSNKTLSYRPTPSFLDTTSTIIILIQDVTAHTTYTEMIP